MSDGLGHPACSWTFEVALDDGKPADKRAVHSSLAAPGTRCSQLKPSSGDEVGASGWSLAYSPGRRASGGVDAFGAAGDR